MRKFLYLCVVTSLALGLSGCKGSDKASQQVRDIAAQARATYSQAVSLLTRSDMADAPTSTSDEILSLLDKAAAKAKEATAISDASEIAKAPAFALLAQINSTKASTIAYKARGLNITMSRMLPEAQAFDAMLVESNAQGEFLTQLAVAAKANSQANLSELAADVLDEYKAKLQSTKYRIADIKKHLAKLNDEKQRLIDMAEPIRQKARQYRRKMVRTEGEDSLQYDTMAGEAEKQYAEINDQIDELLVTTFNAQQQLDIQTSLYDKINKTIASATDTISRLHGRSDLIANSQNEIAAAAKEIKAKYDKSAADISVAFDNMSNVYKQAIDTYSTAKTNAASAVRAMQKRSTEARQLKGEAPNSPLSDALGDLSSKSVATAAIAAQADIAMSSAELGRELIGKAIGASKAINNSDIAKDIEELAAKADEDYKAAIESFEKAANYAQSGQSWIFKNSQAAALKARFELSKLTGKINTDYLQQAKTLVDEIIQENSSEDSGLDSKFAPVKELQEALMQAQM